MVECWLMLCDNHSIIVYECENMSVGKLSNNATERERGEIIFIVWKSVLKSIQAYLSSYKLVLYTYNLADSMLLIFETYPVRLCMQNIATSH